MITDDGARFNLLAGARSPPATGAHGRRPRAPTVRVGGTSRILPA